MKLSNLITKNGLVPWFYVTHPSSSVYFLALGSVQGNYLNCIFEHIFSPLQDSEFQDYQLFSIISSLFSISIYLPVVLFLFHGPCLFQATSILLMLFSLMSVLFFAVCFISAPVLVLFCSLIYLLYVEIIIFTSFCCFVITELLLYWICILTACFC